MKKLKSAAFIFSIILIMFITGCSKKNKQPESVTFSFFTSDATEDNFFNDPVAKEITKRTGVTLSIEHPISGDTQAIPLMIINKKYPDLIYAKGDLTKLISAGAVIPLDDLIEKYGKNMKHLYGNQLVRLRNSISDPHIYSVGTYNVKKAVYETSGSMNLQLAVLKELGYPRMTTLDDYENAIRAYIKKYPTINGKKTIGFSLLFDNWQWYIDLSNPANYLIGYPDNGQWIVNTKTYQAEYKFLDPEIYRYYQWLNKINKEGLLDPDSFTQKEDVWMAKIASGRVLGISYPEWGYTEVKTKLIKNGMQDRTYANLPIVADKKYKCPSLYDSGYSGGWGIAISKDCKDPVRAFKFLDWMCSDEAQILVNWGIKDINYKVINGKRVIPDEELKRKTTDPDYTKRTGVGLWIYPFPEAGTAAVDANKDFLTTTSRQSIIDNQLPIEREALNAYNAKTWTDLFPTAQELGGTSKFGTIWQYTLPHEINEKVLAADDYVKSMLPRIILSDPSEFKPQWNTMQQHLKDMGMGNCGKEVSKLIHEKMELWGTLPQKDLKKHFK